jgi:AmiR/NasT family two-component response regulator
MVLQPAQATVCSGPQSVEASSGVAQLAAEIAQLMESLRQRQQIGVATGLLAQRFAITPKRAMTLTDDADDENRGVC